MCVRLCVRHPSCECPYEYMLQIVIGGRSLPLDRSSPDSLKRVEAGSGERDRATRKGTRVHMREPISATPVEAHQHHISRLILIDFD